jgi:hypothetical protein
LETISNPLLIHEMAKITADARSEYNKKISSKKNVSCIWKEKRAE